MLNQPKMTEKNHVRWASWRHHCSEVCWYQGLRNNCPLPTLSGNKKTAEISAVFNQKTQPETQRLTKNFTSLTSWNNWGFWMRWDGCYVDLLSCCLKRIHSGMGKGTSKLSMYANPPPPPEFSTNCWSFLGSPIRKPNEEPWRMAGW